LEPKIIKWQVHAHHKILLCPLFVVVTKSHKKLIMIVFWLQWMLDSELWRRWNVYCDVNNKPRYQIWDYKQNVSTFYYAVFNQNLQFFCIKKENKFKKSNKNPLKATTKIDWHIQFALIKSQWVTSRRLIELFYSFTFIY
jgi:hypothetical protein